MKKAILAAGICGALFGFVPSAQAVPNVHGAGVPAVAAGQGYLPVQDEGARAEGREDMREKRREKFDERRERLHDRIDELPPEERERALQRLEEMKAREQALREELQALPPEERRERIEALREEFEQKRAAHREEVEARVKERWQNATPEERAAFCNNARIKCDEEGGHACDVTKDVCAQ